MRNFFERTRTTAYMCRCGGDLRPTKYGAACSTCGKQVFNMVEGLPIGNPFLFMYLEHARGPSTQMSGAETTEAQSSQAPERQRPWVIHREFPLNA